MTATATTATQTQPPIKLQRMRLPEGDAGIARTIALMKKIVTGNEGAPNPEVRRKALEIIRNVPNGDRASERNALFQWVKSNIKFRGEYQETLQSPLVTLQLGAGDCDDHSTLMAALLESIGHETMFKTVATDGMKDFSHVFTLDLDAKTRQWIAVDTTVASSYPGWESPRITRAKSWGNNLAGTRGVGRFPGLGYMPPTRVKVPRRLGDVSDIFNSLQPLINASAIRLAYGNNAGLQPFTQNLAPPAQIGNSSVTIPSWVPWAVGLGFFAVFANGLRGGRR